MLTQNAMRITATAAAIAWVAALLATAPASAEDAAWTVSEVTGGASIEVAGRPAVQATADLAVSSGARVTTDDGGRLSLTNGASVMTLSPGTEIEIREAPEPGRTSIFQRIGVLMLEVERRAREHFEVETPYLAAVVKGTRFSVSVADAGAAVHVTDGMVEVSAPAAAQPVLVHPGQTAMVDSGGLDTIRLDGGRSENILPEQGLPAAHQPDDGDAGANQVIRRSIGDASIDIGAASDGLVTSKTVTTAKTSATNTVAADADGTAANGSAVGVVEAFMTAVLGDSAGDASGAGGLGSLNSGPGNAKGGGGNGGGGLGSLNSGPGNAIGGGNGGGGLGSLNSGPGNTAGGPGASAQSLANDAAKAANGLGNNSGKGGPGL